MRVTGLLAPQNTFLDTIATRFDGSHSNFVLGNAAVEQYPIVYCSDGFCDLTGFLRVQIMQRSAYCKFLYGKSTDKVEKCKFRSALQQQNEYKGVLLLYTKNSKPFYCLLDVVPIKNDQGNIVLFLVSFKDITLEKVKEMKFSGISFPLDFPKSILDSVVVEEEDPIHRKKNPLDYKGHGHNSENHNNFLEGRNSGPLTGAAPNSRLPGGSLSSNPSNNLSRKDSMKGPRLRARNTLSRASIKLRSLTLDRRRSRAVLYNLNVLAEKSARTSTRVRNNWGVSGINSKHNFQKQIPEYKMATMEHSVNYIIFHYSNIKILWDMLIMIATLYVACVVPYYAAFADYQEMVSQDDLTTPKAQTLVYRESKVIGGSVNNSSNSSLFEHPDVHGSIALLWWDIIAEILFMVGVRKIVLGSGQVVFKPREIATHYLRTWFIIDVVAALPLDSILKLLDENQNRALKQIQLLKIVRLLRLAKVFHKVETLNTYGFVALLLCVVIFFIMAHWAACLWFWIGYHSLNVAISEFAENGTNLQMLGNVGGLEIDPSNFDQSGVSDVMSKSGYNIEDHLTLSMSWLVKLADDLSKPYFLKMVMDESGNRDNNHEAGSLLNSKSVVGSNSSSSKTSDNDTESPTIIRKIILSQGPNQSQYYVSSLYFTLSSLTSVGFGNIAPNTDLEKKFAIAIMFIGALLHAVVFGHVSSIIQRMHAKSSNFDVKMNNLKEFIRIHHMPRTLKNRIMEYNQAIWSNHNGIDPKEMLKEFPEKLQAEVSLHLYREVFNLPVFQNASKGCLRFLSLHVKEIFVVPGEYLIHHGDPLTAIYLVVSGSLEVVQSQTLTKSNIVAILGKGDLFGLSVQSTPTNDDTFAIPQESFLQNVKSTCDVKALSYCVLQCISKEGVETMLETYPEFRQRFARDLMADYSCSLWSTNEDDLSSSDDEEDSEKENIDTCSNTSYALVPAVTVCPKFHPNGSSSALSSLLGGLPDLITAPIDCMKSPECRSIHQSVIAAAADSTDETMLRVPCGSTSNRTISQGSDMSVTITTGGSQSDNDNSVIIRHDSETSDGIPSSNSLQKDVELPSSSSGNYLTLDNYHPPRFKSSIVIRKKQIRDNPENTNITARKNPVESDSAIYMKTNNTIHEVDELELDNDTFITALPDQILATKKMNRHSYCSGERSIVLGDRKVRFNEIPIYYDSKPISCRSLNKSESSGKLFGRPASIKFSKRPSQLLMAVQCKSTVSKEPDISILGAKESCLVNPLRFGSRRLATISSNDASSEGIRSKETTAENLDANEDPMNELAKGMESKINFSKNDIIKRQLNVQEKKEPDLDQSEESKTITTSSIKEDSPSSPTKTLLDVDEDQDKKQNDLHEFLEDCVINTNLLNKNNLGFVNRPRVATVAPLQAAQTESSISDMLIEPTSNESDQRYISLLPPIIVQDQVSDSGIALDQSKPPETVDQTTITVVPDRFEPERSNPCSPIEDEQDQKSTSDINKGYNQIAKNIQNNHSNTYLNTQSNHQHYYNTHTDSNEIRSLSLQIVQLTSQVVSMKNNEIEVQKQLLELQKTVKTTNDSMLAILNKMNTKMDRMESAQQQAYAQSIQATHAHIHDALSNCVNCSRTGSVTNSCSSVYAGMRKGSRTSIFSDRNSISAMSLLAEDDFERPMQGIQNETRERKEKNIIGLPTCSSNAPMSNKRDRKLSQTSMLGLKIENEMANSSLHAAHKPKSFCKSSSTHANPLQRRRGARDLNLNPESTSLLDTATYNKHNHGHRNSINYINLEADSQDKPGKELQGNSNSNTLNFDRPAISITSTQNLNEPKTNQSPTPKINANMTQIAEVVQSFMQSSSLNSSLNTGNSNAIGRSKSPDVKNQSSSSSMLFTQRANSSSLFLSGHESRRNSKDDRDKDKDKDRNRSNSSTFGSYKLNNKLKQTAEFIRSRNSSQHSQEKNRDQDSFSTGKHKFKNIGEEIRRSRLKSLSSPRLEGGAANQSTNEGKDVVKSPVKPVVYRPK